MPEYVITDVRQGVGIITLNRPHILNAWHRPMRDELRTALQTFVDASDVEAIILTGAGERAFCAGQDLSETKGFDADGIEGWMREWEVLYDQIRAIPKPLVVALNGLAAGSAFQVALLADYRIGHDGCQMGQPEINAGVASNTGPWIIREMLGLARTYELALTGRMMSAAESHALGLINRLVPRERVLDESIALALELAAKPKLTFKLTKQRLREMTEAGFRDSIEAGVRHQRTAYDDGEPAKMMEQFLAKRANR
ncbi:enoyl-CoA hydratase/isomerase family protein [Verticiella sediminum]|uniref:Enoyl-CoA hydratase/isomerase family protein n=1 Tax=Verticiella sediminum TaxID=1247510 RepID=A0A556AU02_9BURK|nr:enoyl-CoA hydratase/isomerase family protein [Verticiella sediminum]TSH96428.1 enoyl-CoA hydratase/isomerase family protein [Verticiella sediminum]